MAQCARELPRGHYGVRSTECRAKAPASAIHPHTKYEADSNRTRSNRHGVEFSSYSLSAPYKLPVYARFRGHATASKPYHADDAIGKGGNVRTSPLYRTTTRILRTYAVLRRS